MNLYPFRLGTTSYIIPADILPNVRYLADKAQDVELVLFEVTDRQFGNLPSKEQIAELRAIAREYDLTYTVHLPLDLRLADDGSPRHTSIKKAQRVIDYTAALDPHAYIVHLDGKVLLAPATSEFRRQWLERAVQALEIVGNWAGDLSKLAVENLEGYPLDFYEPVLEQIAVSRTVDIGHLWLDGHDPVAYLRQALPRTRVIHLHGLKDRDHQSLAHIPPAALRDVLEEIIRADYRGVLTIEVFSEDDFLSSIEALGHNISASKNHC